MKKRDLLYSIVFVFLFAINGYAQDYPLTGRSPRIHSNKDIYGNTKGVESTNAFAYDQGLGVFASVNLTDGTASSIGSLSDFASGADLGPDGMYYATYFGNIDSPKLYSVDPATGTETYIGDITGVTAGYSVNGIAYDAAAGDWYIVAGDPYTLNASELYTIDITTGAATLVGNMTDCPAAITIAIDCGGNAYAVDIMNDNFVSVDLSTGACTIIGPLGIDASFAQDMDFDPDDGTLYWGAYETIGFFDEAGSLRIIDVATGSSTEIINYGAFAGFSGFAVNGECQSGTGSEAYGYNGGIASYGTIDLASGEFSSIGFNFSDGYPAAGDLDGAGNYFTVKSDYSWPPNYSLITVDFGGPTESLIGAVILPDGQEVVKGFAFNSAVNLWYALTTDMNNTAAYLDLVDINTGEFTLVGQLGISNPVAFAIDCDGNAYLVSAEGLLTITSVLYQVDLSSGAVTQIGTTLGLDNIFSGGQDMDFDPLDGSLYWTGYYSIGFFDEGGSFRKIDVTDGTSTEISTFGAFENITGFAVNAVCNPVPVELSSFTANVNGNYVNLKWETATETNNSGFEVERMARDKWERVAFIQGHGTTSEKSNYSYNDFVDGIEGGVAYRLKQIDFDGTFQYSDVVEAEISTPVNYSLKQNYPNPFNPATTIKYSVPEQTHVKLSVFNAIGELVTELVNSTVPAGNYTVDFNAAGLTSGVYFYKIQTNNFTQVRKMMLLK